MGLSFRGLSFRKGGVGGDRVGFISIFRVLGSGVLVYVSFYLRIVRFFFVGYFRRSFVACGLVVFIFFGRGIELYF